MNENNMNNNNQYQPAPNMQQPYGNTPQQPYPPAQPPKKKKKKTLWIVLGVILAFIIIISAFSSGGDDKGTSTENTNPIQSGISATEKNNVNTNGKIGDYVCTVKSAELCKDYQGKDALKVTYTFTNNADEPISFSSALDVKVYQNGVELESVYTFSDGSETNWLDSSAVKKGASKDIVLGYKITDKSVPLEVEISEFWGGDEIYKTTIELK